VEDFAEYVSDDPSKPRFLVQPERLAFVEKAGGDVQRGGDAAAWVVWGSRPRHGLAHDGARRTV